MGSSASKNLVVILDEEHSLQDFAPLLRNELFTCKIYRQFETFIEQQSLKDVSNMIIRERHSLNIGESDESLQNKQELVSLFTEKKRKEVSLREKMISYIKKYSLDNLKVYLWVDQLNQLRISEMEMTYIILASDKLDPIREHMLSTKNNSLLNIKFRRMVLDFYRKVMVNIILPFKDSIERRKEWEKIFENVGIHSYAFSSSLESFEKKISSTHFEFLVCEENMLQELIEFKKKSEIQSKIILYYTSQKLDLPKQKLNHLWISQKSRTVIAAKMKASSSITKQLIETTLPTNTIIYLDTCKYQNQEKIIQSQLIQELGKQKFDKCGISFATNLELLYSFLKKDIFSFVVLFDVGNERAEEIKRKLKFNKFHKRINISVLVFKPSSGNIEENIEERVKQVKKKIATGIKSESAPIESITLYSPSLAVQKFFKHQLGLDTNIITSLEKMKNSYMPPLYEKVIQGLQVVCSYDDYLQQLKPFLDSKKVQETYLRDIKIIIFDSKDKIKEVINSCKKLSTRIIYMHYMLEKVKDFLVFSHIQKVTIPFFPKKALPEFHQNVTTCYRLRRKGEIQLQGSIVSQNQLMQEIFGDKTFKLTSHFEIFFQKFNSSSYEIKAEIETYERCFIQKYAMLWHTGTSIVKDPEEYSEAISTLKDDIKRCFFKCKMYNLIKISDDEFQYFYIVKIDQCKSLIDLQIACIYIYSLPHGFSNVLKDIFKQPERTTLAIQSFCYFIFVLLTAYCSFEEEILEKREFVIYVEESKFEKIFRHLNVNDYFFNTGFIPCAKNENVQQNQMHHCIIFEFQNIPFSSQSTIKQFLNIEGFAFYKEEAECLIAPYTKFQLKKKRTSKSGKLTITLTAVDKANDFVQNVFKTNNLNQNYLARLMKTEVKNMKENENLPGLGENQSLYQKAESIGLLQKKKEYVKAIEKGLIYELFNRARKEKLYLSAQHFLYRKITDKQEKLKGGQSTTTQQAYFQTLLGVQKSLICFKTARYKQAIDQLNHVTTYLTSEQIKGQEDWVFKKAQKIKQKVETVAANRAAVFDQVFKEKKWVVTPVKNEEKVQFSLEQLTEKWEVNYQPNDQLFTIKNLNSEDLLTIVEPEQEFSDCPIVESGSSQLYSVYDPTQRTHFVGEQEMFSLFMRDNLAESYFDNTRSMFGNRKDEIKESALESGWEIQTPSLVEDRKPAVIVDHRKEERQKEAEEYENDPLYKFERSLGVKVEEKAEWQVFYYGNKYDLVRKKKHFKMKMTDKNNFQLESPIKMESTVKIQSTYKATANDSSNHLHPPPNQNALTGKQAWQ